MFLFCGLCENLWGGSPAAFLMLLTVLYQLLSTTFVNKFPDDLSLVQPASFEDEEEEFEESVETSTSFEEVTKRRERFRKGLRIARIRK